MQVLYKSISLIHDGNKVYLNLKIIQYNDTLLLTDWVLIISYGFIQYYIIIILNFFK